MLVMCKNLICLQYDYAFLRPFLAVKLDLTQLLYFRYACLHQRSDGSLFKQCSVKS